MEHDEVVQIASVQVTNMGLVRDALAQYVPSEALEYENVSVLYVICAKTVGRADRRTGRAVENFMVSEVVMFL
jgi:hypothetical protein